MENVAFKFVDSVGRRTVVIVIGQADFRVRVANNFPLPVKVRINAKSTRMSFLCLILSVLRTPAAKRSVEMKQLMKINAANKMCWQSSRLLPTEIEDVPVSLKQFPSLHCLLIDDVFNRFYATLLRIRFCSQLSTRGLSTVPSKKTERRKMKILRFFFQ
jgi:hypothetical protein